MADFWGGVAQGFGPAYEASSRRREKRSDLAEAAVDRIIEEYIRLGGDDTRTIEGRDKPTLLAGISDLIKADAAKKRRLAAADKSEQRGYDKQVALSIEQRKRDAVKDQARLDQEAIIESLPPAARERALGGHTLFTGKQPLPATSWRGQELGPDTLKGLPTGEVGQIGKYEALSPMQRKGAALAGQRIVKEEADKSNRLATHDLAKAMAELQSRLRKEEKQIPPPTKPPTPELSTEDAVDGIIQMRAKLGPEGSRGPQPSREALLKMGRGPIMQLYGAFKQKVESIVQPTAAERDDAKLDEYADEFDTASPDRQAQITRKAQTILSKRGDGKWTPEDVTKYLQSGQPPEEVSVPFEETAAERGQREKRLSMLKNMDNLLQTAEKQDWTGLIPGLKSEFFDKILPAGGLDKFANIKRLKFRSELGANAYAMARELLEESRMTDADFQHLRRYTPEEWMEKPEVLAKLRSLNELVRAKLMIQDKRAGKAPLFSLSPVEFFNQMDVPNEKFGGAVTVPSEIAPAVIRNSLTFQYIKGNEKNPVTANYISKLVRDGKLDRENATLWIYHLGLPLE